MHSLNRWWIAFAGVCLQMALGSAYAWSVFRIPLAKQFGWSIPQVTLTFTISFFFLGCTAFLGGLWLNRKGPKIVAMTAGVLWGGGVFLASFAAHKLWLLYLSYGVIGGTGLGLGYIVPVAVLVKWFPERRGLITGIAVGGFGAGALIAAPVASRLMQKVGVLPTFEYLGIGYLIVAVVAGSFMRNPPKGWKPAGWTPSASQISERSDRDYSLGEALKTWQWWALCSLMSLNTMAGLSIMSQAAPIFQEMGHLSAIAAAGLVGVVSIGNGVGRVFWAWVSDLTTRKTAFFLMFLIQAVLFWTYHSISSVLLLGIVTFIILMCYGGAYGITPAFAADYFGPRDVGPIFGLMLFPWAFAAAFGPLLFAYLRQATGGYGQALHLIAGMLTVSLVLPILVSPPRSRIRAEGPEAPARLELEPADPDPGQHQ
ncbi:MAG TPA: OFA family MFS transporter [Verrucomicrobiae bacterium]|jgi:OFA family oxalate/formate antiporter-like MFS transporter|nr:OFA family MFS transporter [Verrucomicrobiae bacterium]